LGGERVEVEVLIKAGADPHTAELTPRQIIGLEKAKVFFLVGLPLEKTIMEKMNDGALRVDVTEGVTHRGVEGGVCHNHNHDPHMWFSLTMLQTQAVNICAGLKKADPAGSGLYNANLKSVLEELQSADRDVRELLKPLKGKTFLAYHPAYGYFADDYGMKQMHVEVEGKAPSARQLLGTVKSAREQGIRTVFVAPQFDRKSAEAIAETLGADIVVVDALAERTADEIRRFADALSLDARKVTEN
jgi:zinc transport system substrate-binding protein